MNQETHLPFSYYLKIGLASGLPFAILMMLFNWAIGDTFSLWKFFSYLILFGILNGIFSTKMQTFYLKKLGVTRIDPNTINVRQSKIIDSNASLNEVFDLLEKKLFIKKINLVAENNSIKMRTKFSTISWSEIVQVKKLNEVDGLYQYEVSSKPFFPQVMFDAGRNYKNVLEIEKLIATSS